MTETEARTALETAITDYARVTGDNDDSDYLIAWHVITLATRMDDPDLSVMTILAPPTLSAELQLGMLHAATIKAEQGYGED